MPFDGLVVKNIVKELKDVLLESRIEKIFQPESDEIVMNIRANRQNLKLLLSASASYPRIHLTEASKQNPDVPPMFCMLLRKHLTGGKITNIEFHDYERMVTLYIDSADELGDISTKRLIIEIMGRHSNIILVNSQNNIIDAIKRVDHDISSVREVLPGKPYSLPPAQNKTSLEELDIGKFINTVDLNNTMAVEKLLLNTIKGFSPLICREICLRCGIEPKTSISSLSRQELSDLSSVLNDIKDALVSEAFTPCIVYDGIDKEKPVDFHCLKLQQFDNVKYFDSINTVLDIYYSEKDRFESLKQKKTDLQKILSVNIDRCNKKKAIQEQTLREVADRDKLKLYGELIIANMYAIPKNADKVSLLNYYSDNNEYIEVPLDPNLTPQQNSQKYYKKYMKAKNTFAATSQQLDETLKELSYLESVQLYLENCNSPQEIDDIKQELAEQGYLSLKKKKNQNKQDKPLPPHHFKSTDGFDIFVGKNNKQNDRLTLRQSSANDIWLHTRNTPGSHVIIKSNGAQVPDNTLLEAAMLAAFFSKAKFSSNVPVDYTLVRNVKKPNGAKPGMVIYENFKTIFVTPQENVINTLKIKE